MKVTKLLTVSISIRIGIEIYYLIKFKPQEIKEYSLDLVCSTEREKFLYPIRVLGHQPQVLYGPSTFFYLLKYSYS